MSIGTEHLDSTLIDPPINAPPGRLPDFLILGAPRCGTTFLYNMLSSHPNICFGRVKEANFFDRKAFARGIRWYMRNFPAPRQIDGTKILTGDASPRYLHHPLAPYRAACYLPCAKLIAVIRNPVERTYSEYQLVVRRGLEPLSFEAAIELEHQRVASDLRLLVQGREAETPNFRRFSYVGRSVYADQFERWFRYFPREQMLVVRSEDLFGSPATVGREILRFLGVTEINLDTQVDRNSGNYEYHLSEQFHCRLSSYFRPHNIRLSRMFSRDFKW